MIDLYMEEIFRKYEGDSFTGTDKNTIHAYLAAYESMFEPRRDEKIRLLEIGVSSGGSLMAWADYFTHPETEIIGVDINPNLLKFTITNSKIQMYLCDATNKANLDDIHGTFDFVIDDGSHFLQHQIASFDLLKDRVNPGGLYIIEDIQGPNDLEVLIKFVEQTGREYQVYDTRHVKGRYDDLMLVIKV